MFEHVRLYYSLLLYMNKDSKLVKFRPFRIAKSNKLTELDKEQRDNNLNDVN